MAWRAGRLGAAEWNDGTVAPGLSDRPGGGGARALPSLFLPSPKAVAATQVSRGDPGATRI